MWDQYKKRALGVQTTLPALSCASEGDSKQHIHWTDKMTGVLPYQGHSKEKNSTSKQDDVDYDVKVVDIEGEGPPVDYSGFTQKTDPVEIKLVRKLDLFIMVRLLLVALC